jgi:hypothetical protein
VDASLFLKSFGAMQALSISIRGLVLPIPKMESSGFVSVELGGYTAQMCPFRTPSSEETGTLCILKDAMPLPADELIPMASMLRRAPINVSVVVQDVASGGEMRTVAHGRLLEGDIPVERTRDVEATSLGLGGLRGVEVLPIGQLEVEVELVDNDTVQRGVVHLSIVGLELRTKEEERLPMPLAKAPSTPMGASTHQHPHHHQPGKNVVFSKSPVGVDERGGAAGDVEEHAVVAEDDAEDADVEEEEEHDVDDDDIDEAIQHMLHRVNLQGSVESLHESLAGVGVSACVDGEVVVVEGSPMQQHTHATPPPPAAETSLHRRPRRREFIFPAVGMCSEGETRVQLARFSTVAPGSPPGPDLTHSAAATLANIDRQRQVLVRPREQGSPSPSRLPVAVPRKRSVMLHYTKQ